MTRIHPSSVVHAGAALGADVTIGPFCVVGEHVTLGDGVLLHSHAVVEGRTKVGEGTQIFPFASIGHIPQDLKFKGEASTLEIGKHNLIREHVTMNPGTEGGGMVTRVGDHCLFMMGAHVAHDCLLGNHVIMANNATLAGHVEVGDHAFIGGLAAVHQFVRIGRHAMIGGMSGVEADVIPFGLVMGERAGLAGLNLVGLKRRNFDRDTIHAMRNVYRDLFEDSAGTLQERAEKALAAYQNQPDVRELIEFVLTDSKRSICV
jgi:UDP-N-acetylglucosamine acyltransferase